MEGFDCRCSGEFVSQKFKPDVVKVCCMDDKLWLWLFTGGPSEGVFARKGESVALCLSMIIEVCEEMLVEGAVTASLWNLLLSAKYVYEEI